MLLKEIMTIKNNKMFELFSSLYIYQSTIYKVRKTRTTKSDNSVNVSVFDQGKDMYMKVYLPGNDDLNQLHKLHNHDNEKHFLDGRYYIIHKKPFVVKIDQLRNRPSLQ